MNRKNLTAAVLAGLAGAAGIVGSAQAVNINPDGLGQVLIYPYYTTNGGNQTILSVVNTSDEAKAVKVRFLEGQNSQEVLDFNLYMSAYDVWAAAIFNNEGTPTLVVNDTSCTVPYLYENTNDAGVRNGWQEFLPYQMMQDGGSSEISRAAEGYFEMIEMGTLVNDNGIENANGSASAATHVPSAVAGQPAMPRDCQQLVDAWSDPDNTVAGDEGYWMFESIAKNEGPLTDLENPSGGLFGGAAVVNPDKGTMVSYDARAINGFAEDLGTGFSVLHQPPGTSEPGLNSGNGTTGHVATIFLDNGTTLSSTSFTRGVDAVSYLFMHDQIMNEYTTQTPAAAATEWVVTFPTKSFYVYPETSGSDEPIMPFTSLWEGSGACEVVAVDRIWDREEQTPGLVPGKPIPPIVSPAPPTVDPDGVIPFSLCFETSVIMFNGNPTLPAVPPASTPVLGSTNFHMINNGALGFDAGWVRLQLADYPETDANGLIVPGGETYTRTLDNLTGLPVTGFAVERFERQFTGDGLTILANYAGLWNHRGTRMQSTGTENQPGTPPPAPAPSK